MEPVYPTWICHDCGVKYGAWYKKGEYVVLEYNTCPSLVFDPNRKVVVDAVRKAW